MEVYIYSQQNSPSFKKLKKMETKYNLTHFISAHTRCTAASSTILDLIFTNSSCIASASPIEINISDHEPVVIIRKSTRQKLPRVSFTCRSYQNYSREAFQADLYNHDWSLFYDGSGVDEMWDIMEQAILDTADSHCPYKSYNERVALSPWLSQDLLELMKDRDRLYKLAKRGCQLIG